MLRCLIIISCATLILGDGFHSEPLRKSTPPPPPEPYAYNYQVRDEETFTSFDKEEQQDSTGFVSGSYKVSLPDGRIQTVTYTADAIHGFEAEVTYEGEAQYPPEPTEEERHF
ncbi:cuticle protein 18.6 [Lepeophtheirus salmonis]|uniref:cuticle protein 18.6 n=1 Tax=Lepeophtheirus salmonis TaxID=72036 RepID=UPI001AEA7F05|nr:cuticle protein 21-like [Lepeophtheirus salmonis]